MTMYSGRKQSHGKIFLLFEPETLAYFAAHPTMTGAEVAALDAEIKSIKGVNGPPTPLTLSSLTLNLSLASGAYFITRCSVDLTRYAGIAGVQYSVAATGTPAVTAVYGGVTAGVAETTNTNIFATFDFTSGWVPESGATISDADTFATSSTGKGIFKADVFTTSALYKSSLSGSTLSGNVTIVDTSSATNIYATMGGSSVYRTASYTDIRLRNSSISTTDITSMIVQKVLTPDSTGILASALTAGEINTAAATYVVTVSKP